MNFLIKILISSLAVMITGLLLPGVRIQNYWLAVIVAVLLALLNTFLKPLLIILTIPATIFTLGLFLLVINAFIIMLADQLVDGFEVDGFWWALLFSIVLSTLTSIMQSFD